MQSVTLFCSDPSPCAVIPSRSRSGGSPREERITGSAPSLRDRDCHAADASLANSQKAPLKTHSRSGLSKDRRARVSSGAEVKNYALECSSSERMTLAGTPPTKLFGGTSFVT